MKWSTNYQWQWRNTWCISVSTLFCCASIPTAVEHHYIRTWLPPVRRPDSILHCSHATCACLCKRWRHLANELAAGYFAAAWLVCAELAVGKRPWHITHLLCFIFTCMGATVDWFLLSKQIKTWNITNKDRKVFEGLSKCNRPVRIANATIGL